MSDASFGELDSDARFKRVLSSTKPRLVPDRVENWSSASGKLLGKVAQNSERVLLTIDRRKAPEFADFVLSRLQDLYLEFETRSTEQSR
jgi:ParB family chromosome partitioning protein